jgi:putative ABC transport system permease protein
MTRLAGRRSEFAVRLAIGGSTGRILRQLFIENLLLAGMGSVAGVGCAYGLLSGLIGIIPFNLPVTGPIQIDATVLGFTIVVSFVTTLLFTIVPFFSNTRVSCDESLRMGGRSIGGGRRYARGVLVVTEVALSTMMLIAAGLLINSLYRLHQEDVGVHAAGVVTIAIPVPTEQRQTLAAFLAFTEQMLQTIRSTGIRRPAAVNVLPLDGQSNIPTQRYNPFTAEVRFRRRIHKSTIYKDAPVVQRWNA